MAGDIGFAPDGAVPPRRPASGMTDLGPAKRLQHARFVSGEPIYALAQRAGCSPQALHAAESGRVRLGPRMAAQIEQALSLPAGHLLGEPMQTTRVLGSTALAHLPVRDRVWAFSKTCLVVARAVQHMRRGTWPGDRL